jgi:DNA-binding beta-propeller fold protein YncE
MHAEVGSMTRRILLLLALAGVALLGTAPTLVALLPSGWRLSAPNGPLAVTGTMPQGIALSPDGTQLAVVESGDNPPALRILATGDLSGVRTVALAGAFGKPVWQNADTVWVAGANADDVVAVDTTTGKIVTTLQLAKGAWPAAIALSPDATTIAVANDASANVVTIDLASGARAQYPVGDHPSDLAFSPDGTTLYVASRSQSTVHAIGLASGSNAAIHVGDHPAALALSPNGNRLFVAASDDDAIDVIDTAINARVGSIDMRLHGGRVHGNGALPNALRAVGDALYVTLGGANAVAMIRGGKIVAEVPTGWYPTGVDVGRNGSVYVSDGKGEGTHVNSQFNPFNRRSGGYVAALAVGSVRKMPPLVASAQDVALINAMPQWTAPPAAQTMVRPNGPIRHVIYVIKENRSYDQVLGDIRRANGDPSLVMFGNNVTPNQHAIARRFGIFDNSDTNAQVSADGHNWTDAAIADDYVERFWPPDYAGRRSTYDFQDGIGADVPHSGYLWDDAARAHITYRDYGEDIDPLGTEHPPLTTTFPGLRGHYDPQYVGWGLDYRDADRVAEWKREFEGFIRNGNLPQLEIVYLPNDHTKGTKAGAFTPQAYVAQNDLAVGTLVDVVSHSKYWGSTAIFVLEDDAQNGPDHVSDQRSTFYVASPYANGGVHHERYSTAAVLHTIEIILGLQPLSLYDDTAQPMYAAFSLTPHLQPYNAIRPKYDMNARNTRMAYGAALSARQNWAQPDQVDPTLLNTILERSILGHTVHPR